MTKSPLTEQVNENHEYLFMNTDSATFDRKRIIHSTRCNNCKAT